MGEVEARGGLERTVLASLHDRGWTVVDGQRRGLDLDLQVELDGTAGVIQLRNSFEVSDRAAKGTESSPTYVRVDLGEPAGEPSRWSVWDRYEFPSGKHAPRYHALVVHEAIGEGWASVAGCWVAPGVHWYAQRDAIDVLLYRAAALAPGRDEAERRTEIFETQRQNFSAQTQLAKSIVSIVVLFLVAALFGLAVVGNWPSADVTDREVGVLAMLLLFGLPSLIFSIVGLVLLVKMVRMPLRPLEAMGGIVEMLRGTGAFSDFTQTARKDREALPVVVRSQGILDAGGAWLSVSRLSARSSSHPVTLEGDLCQLTWPDGALPETRFVPDRWLTTDLAGSEADLAKLPSGPREERRAGVVRWTFTGAEIDAGEAEQLFRQIVAAPNVAAGPYR